MDRRPPPARSLEQHDQELLGRVMTTVIRLEQDVQSLHGQTRDLSVIKKMAIGVLSLLVPSLIGAGVNLIQGEQRLRTLEGRVAEQIESERSTSADMARLHTDVSVLTTESQTARAQSIETLNRILDRLEKIESPRRNR
jgi:hypothetical protein